MEHPTNAELVDNLSNASGTLGAKIVELGTSLAQADQQMQTAHLGNFIQPLLRAPNIVLEQVESMPEGFDDLIRRDERPAITAVDAGRFAFDTAEFEFDMEVSSHTEHKKETGVEAGVEVGASGGWGPVSAHVSMHTDVSHKDEQTRSTDTGARMKMKLGMKRQEQAEGLAKMIDQANDFSKACNDIRLKIAGAKLAEAQQKIADGDIPAEANAVPEAPTAE